MVGSWSKAWAAPRGVRLLLAWLVAFSPATAYAEGERQMAAIAAASDGHIEALMALPKPKVQDWLYQDYVSSMDNGLARSYADTWRYHEMQTRFSPMDQYGGEFQQMGALTVIGENEMRAQFASGVLRTRIDAMIRNAFTPRNVPSHLRRQVQRVQQQLNQVRNTTVSFSKAKNAPRMQVGYDVLTDFTKAEVVADEWNAGIYHSRFMSSLSGGALPDSLALRVSANLGHGLPAATITYLPYGNAVQGSLSRWLSPRVNAAIMTTIPTGPLTTEHRHQVSLGYYF